METRDISEKSVREAVAILKQGGVVAVPTETSYGLAADATNASAVRKIYGIKGREKGKPLPLIASSFAQAARYVALHGLAAQIAKKYWPGPVTIVALIADAALGRALGVKEAAVRVPLSKVARSLARRLGRPITSTSANLSDQPASYSGDDVRSAFGGRRHQPDLLLDAGRLPRRQPSTIVRIDGEKIAVLRQGTIRVDAIKKGTVPG